MANFQQISSVERQNAIQKLIEIRKRISINAVCETFLISQATARRDLEVLGKSGKIQRVHGGAISLENSPPELPILQRENEQTNEKARIGKIASQLINSGDTIFLGSGTTVLALARQIHNCENLTVLTNSLPITNLLVGCSGVKIIVLGGMFRDTELSFIGHITEKALSEVRADKVFIGARAISNKHGLTNDYLPETMTDRAIVKIGQKIIVVADHTKFGSVSTAFLSAIEEIDVIVTDNKIDMEYVESIKEKGVDVIIA